MVTVSRLPFLFASRLSSKNALDLLLLEMTEKPYKTSASTGATSVEFEVGSAAF